MKPLRNGGVRFCAVLLATLALTPIHAQVWTIDFGTATGVDSSGVASTTFIPTPTSGTARVRAGTGTRPGKIELINQGLSVLGTESELRLTANTGSISPTKFSVFDYAPAKVGKVTFDISFGNGLDGVYAFVVGNGGGYSDNSAIGLSQVFAGIKWNMGNSSDITVQVANQSSYTTSGLPNATSLFTQDTTIMYHVALYLNNDIVTQKYVVQGELYSLNADSWDLWVNGTRIGLALPSGGLTVGANIDSYAFIHQSNVANPGTVYIDNIVYANELPYTDIYLSKNRLVDFDTIAIGYTSVLDSFYVKAKNVTEGITVYAPLQAKVSLNRFSYADKCSIPVSFGSLTADSVWVYCRFEPIVIGRMIDSILIEIPGFDSQCIVVSGTGWSNHSGQSVMEVDANFSYPQHLSYMNYQSSNMMIGQSLEVARFIVRDGGLFADSDSLPTVLTAISFSVDHATMLNRIGIYADTVELAEVDAAPQILFDHLLLQAPDDSIANFSIRVTFKSEVKDHSQLKFTLLQVVADTSGSLFRFANGGGVSTSTHADDNRIAVVGSQLFWLQQPTSSPVNMAIQPAPQVAVVDSLGNIDIDYAGVITVTSTGILGILQSNETANMGIAMFPAIIHSSPANDVELTAQASGLVPAVSNSIDVLDPPVSIVSFTGPWSGAPLSALPNTHHSFVEGNMALTRGTGLVAESSSSRFNASGWSTAAILNPAVNQSYISFSLESDPAYQLNLNNAILQITVSSSATGPASYALYTSVGGFALVSDQVGSTFTSGASISFPSTGYGHVSQIEFRIYGWQASSLLGTGGIVSLELIAKNSPIVFEFNGAWSPVNPSGISTDVNTISVLSGSAHLQSDIVCNNVLLAENSYLAIDSGNTLTIHGVVSGKGMITGGPLSRLTILGSGLFGVIQMDQTNHVTRSLGCLKINRTDGEVGLDDSLVVYDSLVLINGHLYTNGKLTLHSDSSYTAIVPQIGDSASVIGDVVVERYISSRMRRWRFMSAPCSQTTFEQLRKNIFITGSGSGTVVGTTNSNGFDATPSNQPSVYSYNETASGNLNMGWLPLTNSSSSLNNQPVVPGKGYRIFIRGDRSDTGRLTGQNMTQNEVTVRYIGPINQGRFVMPISYTPNTSLADDGWNLLGNPYPCAISWQALIDDGMNFAHIDSIVYVLDATSGSYKSYNALSGGGTLAGGMIPSGASFWVKANAPDPILVLSEKYKVSTIPDALFKSAGNDELILQLERDSVTKDVFIMTHHVLATKQADAYDIRKLNGEINVMSIGGDEVPLAYDVRPLTANNDTIQLYVSGGTQTYVLKLQTLPVTSGKYYYLHDKKYDSTILLYPGLAYAYTSNQQDTASYGYRFKIIISNMSTLPVKDIRLSAHKTKDGIEVTWQAQFLCKRFELEYSCDLSKQWNTITKEDALTSINTYRYQHAGVKSETNYYRLKVVNEDGAWFYTKVLAVNLNDEKDPIVVYPNPISDKVSIQSPVSVLSTSIWNEMGECVLTSTDSVIRTDLLSPGMYWLQIQLPDTMVNKKIFKQ